MPGVLSLTHRKPRVDWSGLLAALRLNPARRTKFVQRPDRRIDGIPQGP